MSERADKKIKPSKAIRRDRCEWPGCKDKAKVDGLCIPHKQEADDVSEGGWQ